MANIPSNLSYGTVNGRFIVGYQDSADAGSEPDAIPASGSIFFSASTNSIKNITASPDPVTIFPATVEAVLDSEGYLCGYGTVRGIVLVATDDPEGNPVNWTWRAEFRLTDSTGTPLTLDSFSFQLPSGSSIDLTAVAPVSQSNGQSFVVGPQGPQGIQGIQGNPGSLSNLTALSPLSYNSSTSTLSFNNPGYATIASPEFTGTVSGITKTMVGLGSVDNTSDASKPVSSATQSALNLKANADSPEFTGTVKGTPADATLATAATGLGYMGIPRSSTAGTTGSYTITAADAGEHIYATDIRTVTIPSNATLALPIGTTIVFIAGPLSQITISITSDTMRLAGPGTVGNRTLSAHGVATAVKVGSTEWYISGTGLS